MKCIAVDDEPMALEVMEEYIHKTPFVSLSGTFRSPLKAIDYLNNHPVDLLFLDINMPDLSGLQLIKAIEHKPMVILTTAYSKYALESYELDVIDYLLKPIQFDRFLKAVNKAKSASLKTVPVPPQRSVPPDEAQHFTFIKSSNDLVKLVFDDIHYIEGNGNYLTIHLAKSKIMTLMKMSEALNILPEGFVRIHKSFILAIHKIDKAERHQVWIGDIRIPIGSTYRANFLSSIQR